jgi:type III secretory pathway component EscV/predicted Zn-dependent protease
MKLKELIPTSEQLKLVQGIEKKLLRRKSKGIIVSSIIALSGGLVQVLIEITAKKHHVTEIFQYVVNYFEYLFYVFTFNPAVKKFAPVYELAGIFILGVGIAVYLLFKKTRFLLKESEEPFRYTFWIEPFKPAKKEPEKGFAVGCDDDFHAADSKLSCLLHHDLMERLNERIKRFSLLDLESAEKGKKGGEADSETRRLLSSHIHIGGHYTFRKEKNGEEEYVIYVMPQVRIGPPESPAILAKTVKYPLEVLEGENTKPLDAHIYDQIVERVYSSIATRVYEQIESDVKEKISLFPTRYMRASALFHEAEDFTKSNTLDAYDRAVNLYKEALRYFRKSVDKRTTKLLIRKPVLWRLKVKSVHMHAKVLIGYASCLIYRRKISALTGRRVNPLFGLLPELKKMRKRLQVLQEKITGMKASKKSEYFMAFLSYPGLRYKDRALTFSQRSRYKNQKQLFFDTAVILAFTYYELEAVAEAEEELENARAIDPQQGETNPLYLLAAGRIEPDIDAEIRHFQLATEFNPNFQIAQYLLSYYLEMQFRFRKEINPDRAQIVLDEYKRVLEINPGNIAALAARGYIYWLVGHFGAAKAEFREGCDFKTIESETFVGVLIYGLARIAAEEGRFNTSYDLYTQAISADPWVGAYSMTVTESNRGETSYYNYIDDEMLQRYRIFRSTVKEFCSGKEMLDTNEGEVSETIKNSVHSFVLNDYGNACFNYCIRFGDFDRLKVAVKAYREAIKNNPQNAVARYNLAKAYFWEGKVEDSARAVMELEEAFQKMPDWQAAVIFYIESMVYESRHKEIKKKIEDKKSEIEKNKELTKRLDEEVVKIENKKKKIDKEKVDDPELSIKLKNEVDACEREIIEKKKEIRKYEEQLKSLETEKSELEKEMEKKVNETATEKIPDIFRNTKLHALTEDLKIDYDGGGVDQFLSMEEIKWDRLDEHDVEALKAWAYVLSNNKKSRAALTASNKLFEHIIEKYYPAGNFDINLTRFTVLSEFEKQEHIEVRKEECKINIEKLIVNWLTQDPVHYNTLAWSIDRMINIFDFQQQIKLFTRAVRLRPENHVVQNLLGILYYNNRYYQESIEPYREATKLKKTTSVYHENLARAYKILNQWEEATKEYREAIKFERDKKMEKMQREDVATVLNFEGNEYFDKRDYRTASEKYLEAIEYNPDYPIYYSNLALALEYIEEPGEMVYNLGRAVEELEKAGRLAPETPEYEKRIDYLCNRIDIIKKIGEKAEITLPVVTPIAMEVAGNLTPYIEGDEAGGGLSVEVTNHLGTLKSDILNNYGIKSPAVRFRYNESDLTNGVYLIMIEEIPLVMGNVSVNKKFFPGPLTDLEAHEISTNDKVKDPVSGAEGCWVEEKEWDSAEAAGLELWDIVKYPVRHLQAILQKNLSQFAGHQEVVNLLDVEMAGEGEKLVISSPGTLTALVNVIKGLLNEGVPVTPFGLIYDIVKTLYPEGKSELTIAETSRSLDKVRPLLPGNNKKYTFLRIGPNFEVYFQQAIYKGNSKPILAMLPEHCQEALSVVRQQVNKREHAAILVEDPEIRPFLRALICLEFPDVPVLSRRELLDGQQDSIIEGDRIEFEEPIVPVISQCDIHLSYEPVEDSAIMAKPVIKVFTNKEFRNFSSAADDKTLEELFDMMDDGLFYELGIRLPQINLEIDDRLKVNQFRFQLNTIDFPVEEGLKPDRFLVNDTIARLSLHSIKGEKKYFNPANGNECTIVRDKDNMLEKCAQAGYTTWGPYGVMILSLSAKIRKHAAMFLTEDVADAYLVSLGRVFPNLVKIARERFDTTTLTRILRDLLDEEISIRYLRDILEGLLSINGTTDVDLSKYIVFNAGTDHLCPVSAGKNIVEPGNLDVYDYVMCVRSSMKKYISHKYSRGYNTLVVYLLDPEIEQRIPQMKQGDEDHKRWIKAVKDEVGGLTPGAKNPAILTISIIRRKVRKLIEADFPDLAVVAYQELSPDMNIQPIARISW